MFPRETSPFPQFRQNSLRAGFGIGDLAIVLMVVAACVATVLPQFMAAGEDAKEATLQKNLKMLQTAINLYHLQHDGTYPASGSRNAEQFRQVLLLSTDVDGTVGAVGAKPFGPYLIGQIPVNPMNGSRGIKFVDDISKAVPDGDTEHGWIYSPWSGRIKPNSTTSYAE